MAAQRLPEDDEFTSVRVPKSALTLVQAPPDLLSQRNVEATTGINSAFYLRPLLGEYKRAGGQVTELGHLRLVDRVQFVSWIKRREAKAKPEVEETEAARLERELGIEVSK